MTLSKFSQRLAHAHHHHVGDAAVLVGDVAEVFRRHPHLADDLGSGQVAVEALRRRWSRSWQFSAQPICEDTHSVPRVGSGMYTVSIALPLSMPSNHLCVPSAARLVQQGLRRDRCSR